MTKINCRMVLIGLVRLGSRCTHEMWTQMLVRRTSSHHSSLLLPVVGTGCGHNDARTLPLPPSAEGGASGSRGL